MGKYARMRLRYLKEHRPALYTSLLFSGKFNEHLSEIETSAQAMMKSITNRLKQERGIAETLKAENQMLWVQRMNAVREMATEIVNNNLIYA